MRAWIRTDRGRRYPTHKIEVPCWMFSISEPNIGSHFDLRRTFISIGMCSAKQIARHIYMKDASMQDFFSNPTAQIPYACRCADLCVWPTLGLALFARYILKLIWFGSMPKSFISRRQKKISFPFLFQVIYKMFGLTNVPLLRQSV